MRYKLLVLIMSLFFSHVACLGQNTKAFNYIKNNAHPIDNIDSGLQDLSFLQDLCKDRRIIGMGEATHGTQEFQETKTRVFKYLVTKLNYNLFGIEANFSECRAVNDYVLFGKGDPLKSLALISANYYFWNTAQMLKLIEWMRTYNMSKPDAKKIKFYGFDMQYERYPVRQIISKLSKLDSNYFNNHFSELKNLHIINKFGIPGDLSKSKRDSIQNLIDQINIYVKNQDNHLLKVFSKDDVAYLNHDIRILQQCLDEDKPAGGSRVNSREAADLRDKYMAENIKWILDYEGQDSKIMLWAHNEHLNKSDIWHKRMGYNLKQEYKEQYYVIGFDFNKGSFLAFDVKTFRPTIFTVPDADEKSSGYFFSTLNIPEFFIDMEKAVKENAAAKSFFTNRILQRSTGGTFDMSKEKDTYLKDPLYTYYDGLIFVNNTSAIKSLK
jgi:erythromycin esterase